MLWQGHTTPEFACGDQLKSITSNRCIPWVLKTELEWTSGSSPAWRNLTASSPVSQTGGWTSLLGASNLPLMVKKGKSAFAVSWKTRHISLSKKKKGICILKEYKYNLLNLIQFSLYRFRSNLVYDTYLVCTNLSNMTSPFVLGALWYWFTYLDTSIFDFFQKTLLK